MARRPLANITIRAVAEQAGVSAMTVSNVVNRTGRVSPATAEAVQAAITALNYVPNVAARRLARAHATTLGLMYSDRRTPFLEAILVGALRAANARGMQLVLHEGGSIEPAGAIAAAQALVRSGADALLLIPPFAELLSEGGVLDTLGVPAAAIATGRPLPGLATVRIDNHAAMMALTRGVLARGHRRIALVSGPSTNSDVRERRRGFDDALAQAGLIADPALLFDGRFDYSSGVEAAQYLFARSEQPTAIMCANDEMAAGVAAEALRQGLRLPHDLSLTGFDDTLLAARMWPPLTVVRQPVELMAFTAVELLVVTLAGQDDATPADRVVAHTLIERESVAPYRSSLRA